MRRGNNTTSAATALPATGKASGVMVDAVSVDLAEAKRLLSFSAG